MRKIYAIINFILRNMDRIAIGNRIKSLLKNKKMTQGELATKTGFTQSVISEMISGKRNVMPLVEKLVELFQVSRDYIIAGEENNRSDIIIENNISENGLSKEERLRLLEKLNNLYEQHQTILREAEARLQEAETTMKEIIAVNRILIVGQ